MLILRQVGHPLLLQPDDPHSRKRGYTLALTKCFLRLKPARNEANGKGVYSRLVPRHIEIQNVF